MLPLRSVLCATDFSQFSVSAYRYGLLLAREYRAKLLLLHVSELWLHPSVDYAIPGKGFEESRRILIEQTENELRRFVRSAPYEGIELRSEVREGQAADAILTAGRLHQADMIVVGTHGRRGFDRVMLGSVAERVMRKASCPVLLVGQPSPQLGDQTRRAVGIRRLVFCTDFSENAQRAMDYALSLMDEFHAELTVVHVLEDVPNGTDVAAVAARARTELDRLVQAQAGTTRKIKTEVRMGKAYAQIIDLAAK